MAITIAATGCGGGGGGGSPAPVTGGSPSIDISATAAGATAGGKAVGLHAEVHNTTSSPLWLLEGPGSLSAGEGTDVQYQPPDAENLDDPATARIHVLLDGTEVHEVDLSLTPVVAAGHHWTTARAASPRFTDVKFGNGSFVAGSSTGELWQSADGIAWTQRYYDPLNPNYSVAWGSAGWIGTAFVSSADGVHWSHVAGSNTFSDTSIVFGNGVYLKGASFDVAATSRDGIAWTPTSMRLFQPAFGNGLFMAYGEDASQHQGLYVSRDGQDWHLSSSPLPGRSVAFAAGTFLTTEGDTESSSGDDQVWSSGDARPLGIGTLLGAGDAFFMVADDLGVWLPGQSPQHVRYGNGPRGPVAIAFGNGRFVGVSQLGSIDYSSDGLHWSNAVFGSTGSLYAADFVDGEYTAFSSQGWVSHSSDGQVWTSAPMVAQSAPYILATAHSPTVRVAVGIGCWLRSTDGKHWEPASTPAPSEVLASVLYDGQRFVAIGNANGVYASADGDTWTQIGTVPAEPVTFFGDPRGNRIAFGGGRYVMVGPDGSLATSSDAATWTQVPSLPVLGDGPNQPLFAVLWDGHQFVGAGPDIGATSPDGQTWTITAAPSSYTALAMGDGKIVGVGWGAVAGSTKDGVHWGTHTFPTAGYRRMNAVVYGNGQFVAVGDDGMIVTSER